MMQTRAAIAFSLHLLLLPVHAEDDWPHVRGPDYNGRSTWSGIALPWDKAGPRIQWKQKCGQGYSSFVIVEGKVFTQVQTRAGQFVICLDVRTGKTLWRSRYNWPWEMTGDFPGPYASPTYSDGKVFFTGCYGTGGCLDARTGKFVWSLDLMKVFQAETPGFGYACTPLVLDEKVYLHVGGENAALVALRASDGELLWTAGNTRIAYCSPLPVDVEGSRQILSFFENILAAYDPETGAELWKYQWSDGYDPHPAWPLYEEPYFVGIVAFYCGARTLKLKYEDGQAACEEVWDTRDLSNDILSSIIVDGFIYGFDIQESQANMIEPTDGEFKCFRLETGDEMWKTKATGHASVLACDDRLVIFNEEGTLIIAEATPEEYRELGRAPILPGETCWTQPAIADGYLVVRGGEYIACVNLAARPPTLPPSRVPAPASSEAVASGVAGWLDRYQDISFWAPDFADLVTWFAFCVFGVFGLAACIALAARLVTTRVATVFIIASFLLAVAGVPLYTAISGGFIFTWPAGLYLLFITLLMLDTWARKARTRSAPMFARAGLLCFAAACVGFYMLCQWLFIVAGWGFLVGFLPAWWPVHAAARRIAAGNRGLNTYRLFMLGFTVYFWTSGLFTAVRTGALW